MALADVGQPAGEAGRRTGFGGKLLEVDQQCRGAVVAGDIAAPDLVLDLRPDALAPTSHRIETGTARPFRLLRHPQFLGSPTLRLGDLAGLPRLPGLGAQFTDRAPRAPTARPLGSEEHTSELQSLMPTSLAFSSLKK